MAEELSTEACGVLLLQASNHKRSPQVPLVLPLGEVKKDKFSDFPSQLLQDELLYSTGTDSGDSFSNMNCAT